MSELKTEEASRSTTLAGLVLALFAPALYTLVVNAGVPLAHAGSVATALGGLGVMWLLAAGVVIVVTRGEGRGLASIGWRRPSRALALQALGLGVLLSLTVPILSILASSVVPADHAGAMEGVTEHFPWWVMLLSVMTAGITEEVLFRGYALERLLEWSGSKWLASLVALTFFTLVHAGGWNAAHILGVVLPLGAVLTGLYWWRRSLALVMIVHLMIDLPLVFMAIGNA